MKTVSEVREEFPDISNNLSDDELADFIIQDQNELNKKSFLEPVDYYESLKLIHPSSKFVNVKNYKNTLDQDFKNEKSDLELARDAYEKMTRFYGTGVDFPTFANEFAPRFKRTLKDDVAIPSPYSKFELLEARGIETQPETTINKGRLAGSFAVDDENKIKALEDIGASYFPNSGGIKIFRDELSGELVFRNPKTKQIQTVNKAGLDLGDLGSVAGDTGVAAIEFLGSLAGAPLGPYGSVATGALSAQGAEMGRILLGQKLFGINQDIQTLGDYTAEAADTGLSSLAFGTAGETGLLAFKRLQKSMGRGSITPDDLDGLVKSAAEKRLIVDKLNDKLAERGIKERIKLSVAKATDDPELQAHFNALETDSTKGKKSMMKKFNNENALALKKYFEIMNDGFTSKNLFDKNYQGRTKSLQKMYDFILDTNTADHKTIMTQLAKSKNDLTDEVIALPSGGIKEGGATVRNSVQKLFDLRRKNFDTKFELLFKATDGQRSINTDLIAKAVNTIQGEKKKTLFAMYPDLNNLIKLSKDGKKIKDIDLRTAHNTIRDLLRHNRNLQKGQIVTETAPDQTAINRIIDSFYKQMQQDLGADDRWYGIYTRNRNDFRDNKQLYGKVLGKIIEKDRGRLKIADEDVFDTSFKKNAPGQEERIDDLMIVLNKDSDALNTYKKNILEFYNDQVDPFRTGKIDAQKHKEFMKDYDYSLKSVFGKDGAQEINKIGSLQKKIDEISEIEKETIESLKKTTAGQVVQRQPEELFNFVFKGGDFGGANTQKLKDVMDILKKDDQLKKEFQEHAVEKMLFDTTKRNSFEFIPGKLSDFLNKNEQNLRIVFEDNPQYIKNLLEFEDILNTLQKTTSDKPAEKLKGPLNDILRTRVGMFTTAGRTMTAGVKLARSVLDERMYRFLTDPEALDKLVDFSKKPKKYWETNKGRAIVTDLFGTIPFIMGIYGEGVSPDSDIEDVDLPIQKQTFPNENDQVDDQSAAPSPTVDMFAMEQMPRPTAPAPVTPPPVQQPQPAGIAALPADRGQTYAGLFPNDPSGQMIAQRGRQNA